MPFGLKNAPPTFQRAMMAALQGCEDFAVVYIDDILVFSATREEHSVTLEGGVYAVTTSGISHAPQQV